MRRIVTQQDGAALLADSVIPSLWTALIPAAGRGTRLGVDVPKILFQVAGKSIVVRLADLLLPFCSRFVFVLSSAGAQPVENALRDVLPNRYEIAIQPEPLGMGHAVACGLPLVQTPNVLVIWGDQVALRPQSIDFSARLHQGALRPAVTCPTLIRSSPYIHFDRDQAGRLRSVLQAREGDPMPAEGESDSGLFLFLTEALRRYMLRLVSSDQSIGAKTREINFLPILPMFEDISGQLVCARIVSEAESVGINSQSDARYLERVCFAVEVDRH